MKNKVTKITIGLVGCGKAKAGTPLPAHQLYTGSLFRAAIKHAQRKHDYCFILSAKHHLIALEEVIPPYDKTLVTDLERRVWADQVVDQFQEQVVSKLRRVWPALKNEDITITIYAGVSYADILQDTFIRDGFHNILQPLKGRPIGERLKWFKEQAPQKCPFCKRAGYVKGKPHKCGYKGK